MPESGAYMKAGYHLAFARCKLAFRNNEAVESINEYDQQMNAISDFVLERQAAEECSIHHRFVCLFCELALTGCIARRATGDDGIPFDAALLGDTWESLTRLLNSFIHE